MMRRAHKIDTSQPQIVEDLRKLGYVVAITSGLGNGYPDLHIARGSRSMLVELKTQTNKKPPALDDLEARRALLSPAELAFHREWPEHIAIVFSTEEILAYWEKDHQEIPSWSISIGQ